MKRLLTLFIAIACATGLMAQTYDVLFLVDMNDVTDTYTTPEVNGTFNGWCGGCAPMSDDDGDGIWELVIALEPGFYEFKFAADTWTIQEELTEGSPCTLTTDVFTNRTVEVVDSNIELDTVCWASCDACEDVVPSYSVLFKVDMSQVTDSYTTPEVNGTFNGWCGGCAPMFDDDGDDIWELEIILPEGTHEYKFAADSWGIDESLTEGDPCTITVDGFTNRLIDVTGDVVLDQVCWASCDECESLPNSIEELEYAWKIYPNPANEQLVIEGATAGSMLQLTNTLGQVVLNETITAAVNTLDISQVGAGTYLLSIANENGQLQTTTIIVE
jgi:hypothetical protein